jgi:hypothetical protein
LTGVELYQPHLVTEHLPDGHRLEVRVHVQLAGITTGRARLVEGGDELAGVRPFQAAKRDAWTPTPASAQVPPSGGLHTWL